VSWNSLPAEVKRYVLQFIASSNVYEVAETMKALNATDRFCHAGMQSEQTMVSILARMPYTANAVDLMERLHKFSVIRKNNAYYEALKKLLKNGPELGRAVYENRSGDVLNLLSNKDIDLNWLAPKIGYDSLANAKLYGDAVNWVLRRGNPLIIAVFQSNIDIIKLLLAAGANPDVCKKLPLRKARVGKRPVGGGNIEIVRLLLDAGADPDVSFVGVAKGVKVLPFPYPKSTSEIRDLVHAAQKKRQKRMQLLCGKKI
jgi:hypothetical protein